MADKVYNVNCGFFDSVNSDRLYTAEDMNKPYKRIVSNGVFATQSGTPSTDLQVLSAESGMNIKVKAGEGIFANKWFNNPSDLTITVPSNTTLLPRRDSVIVQVDKTSAGRKGNIVYREGTPASSPVPPNIGTVDNIVEYRIANIYVASGAIYIGQDAIVDLRGSSECPWVTGLITQVDTSTLYAQWQAAYQKYYDDETEAFNTFMQTLTEQLTVSTAVATYESHYTVTAETNTIPINIATFNKAKDVLIVYVNGWRATPDTDYTIDDNSENIILTNTLKTDNTVNFLVIQSVVVGDTTTVLQNLNTLTNTTSKLSADSGWINFTLENSVTAYDTNSTPGVRKYNNQTFIRGAVKGIDTLNTTICTLPESYRPAMDHYFNVNAIEPSTGVIAANVILKVASTGGISISAKSGTIPANVMLPIATNFITG